MKDILAKYNQQHLLNDYDKLEKQISEIDFEKIMNLFKKTKEEISFGEDKIEPISYVDKSKLEDIEKYEKTGEEEIKKGKLAFVTMAGGQRYKTWTQRTKGYI